MGAFRLKSGFGGNTRANQGSAQEDDKLVWILQKYGQYYQI